MIRLQLPLVSPDMYSRVGSGGITGANASRHGHVQCHQQAMMMYAGDAPRGRAPGHNPAYGSVGNDGKWPGTRR